ncbi:MAG: TlpA disulfide reductase family protein [Weeksellaceae bacterium]|jgi:thiol-disulfide isomerase/thioredoxin|nr:TlpA disulfide reductase family protein [Weeksellaceae bacterium]
MKINTGYVISGAAIIVLGLAFFTPLGKQFSYKVNDVTLTGASKELPNREFSLNDKDMEIELKGYNGTADANLADFRGKVVFLNFWGSWCPPCVEEMPSIQKLYEDKGDQIAVVLITLNDKPEKFVPFLVDNQYTMPVYEAVGLLPKAIRPNSFPTTYIIDKNGEVVSKEIQSKDWSHPDVYRILDELNY